MFHCRAIGISENINITTGHVEWPQGPMTFEDVGGRYVQPKSVGAWVMQSDTAQVKGQHSRSVGRQHSGLRTGHFLPVGGTAISAMGQSGHRVSCVAQHLDNEDEFH